MFNTLEGQCSIHWRAGVQYIGELSWVHKRAILSILGRYPE